jgi:choline dehydrogenase-like flavoprotein
VKLDAEPERFDGEQCWPRFSAPGSTLGAAERTCRMTLRSDAVVSHLLMSSDERSARGVCFVDARDRSVHEVFAKSVVLCASTLESTRILLNTHSSRGNGIGNRSGCLGRYLMDHIGTGLHGQVPDLETQVDPAEGRYALAGACGIYIPRFRNVGERAGKLGFARGYGIWGSVQRQFRAEPSTGPAKFFLFAVGEMLPDVANHVSLSNRNDAWGIPTLNICCRHSENELRMAEDAREQAKRMALCAGFVPAADIPCFVPGGLVHEVGTARMGSDRNESYLNAHCQSWEIPNLFVTDGACWTSGAYQNPTLTMMALTAYAARHVCNEVARR